jgi:hypothetical protein
MVVSFLHLYSTFDDKSLGAPTGRRWQRESNEKKGDKVAKRRARGGGEMEDLFRT